MDIWIISIFLLWLMLLQTFTYKSFYGHAFSFLLSIKMYLLIIKVIHACSENKHVSMLFYIGKYETWWVSHLHNYTFQGVVMVVIIIVSIWVFWAFTVSGIVLPYIFNSIQLCHIAYIWNNPLKLILFFFILRRRRLKFKD